MRTLLTLFILFFAGCAVPPAPADPSAESGRVESVQLNAPAFRLHLLEVGGAAIPPAAINGTVRTLQPYFAGPIQVIHHTPTATFDWDAGPFPVLEDGRFLTAADLGPDGERRLASPDHGLLGIAGIPQIEDGIESMRILPLIEPGVALVCIMPGPSEGRGVTGRATRAARSPDRSVHTGAVVLHDSVIRARANWFIPRAKLYQWTLTHELGHVLGVPADRSHIRYVQDLGGDHCTHPECVMYTGVDWRVVVSGLLHGWPMDFCKVCQDELRDARSTSSVAPASSR